VIDASGERALPVRGGSEPGAILHVRMPAYDQASGKALGTAVFELRADVVLGGLGTAGTTVGAVMTAFDHEGVSLFPVPFDPVLLSGDRFQGGGEEWISGRRDLEEPPISLVAAAPLTPFAEPFEAAARTGTAVLAVVALASLLLAALLTDGFTRRLARLAAAADAIAVGDLDRRLEPGTPDDVNRTDTLPY
jgi:methyl-accepting chemotaxis protein